MRFPHRFFVVLFTLCAFLIMGNVAAQENQKPDDVVKSFYHLLDEGKPQEAVKLFSAAHIQDEEAKKVGLEKLTATLSRVAKNLNNYGGVDSVEILSSKISQNGGRAIVKAKATLMRPVDGMREDVFQMKKEGDVWKIYKYE